MIYNDRFSDCKKNTCGSKINNTFNDYNNDEIIDLRNNSQISKNNSIIITITITIYIIIKIIITNETIDFERNCKDKGTKIIMITTIINGIKVTFYYYIIIER